MTILSVLVRMQPNLRHEAPQDPNRFKLSVFAVKTFFKTIKAELIWRHTWETRRSAEMAIFEYINGFYNPRRCHSALGWKSPDAFERKVA